MYHKRARKIKNQPENFNKNKNKNLKKYFKLQNLDENNRPTFAKNIGWEELEKFNYIILV
jgi:hypothetical protein